MSIKSLFNNVYHNCISILKRILKLCHFTLLAFSTNIIHYNSNNNFRKYWRLLGLEESRWSILQVLSFNFILLSELGSVVCYVVDLQSREHHFSKLCVPLSALLTVPEVILFIHCFNFLLNLLIWHFSLAITFSFFLLDYSEVFCKINLILKAVLDLQTLKHFETCKNRREFFF